MPRLYLKEREGDPVFPTTANIFVSGERFGSHIKATFEDADAQQGGKAFEPADFQKTFEAYIRPDFGGEDTFLYRWGGVEASRSLAGEAATFGVVLVIGSYRSNPSVLHISNGQLENTLIQYMNHYLTGCISTGFPGRILPPGGRPEEQDPTGFYYPQANTNARWSSLLQLGYDFSQVDTPIPANVHQATLADIRNGEYLRQVIYTNTIAQPNYDARAKTIWEKFGILCVLDLSIQSEINPGYVLPDTVANPQHLDNTIVCVPSTPNRGDEDNPDLQPVIALLNPLDPIPAAVFTDLVEQEVISHSRKWELEISQDEPIVFQYQIDSIGDEYDYIGTLDELFTQDDFDAWARAGGQSLDMPYRHSLVSWIDRGRGLFEATLHQNRVNRPNRRLTARIRTPETAAEIAKLFPGNPVKMRIQDELKGYWITETEVKWEPAASITLTLFDPTG